MSAAAELTKEDADQRVAEGASLLNEKDIALSGLSKRSLDIGNYAMCIGGQLAAKKEPVDLFTEVIGCDASKGVLCGFDLAYDEASDENYAALTAAWRRVM